MAPLETKVIFQAQFSTSMIMGERVPFGAIVSLCCHVLDAEWTTTFCTVMGICGPGTCKVEEFTSSVYLTRSARCIAFIYINHAYKFALYIYMFIFLSVVHTS